MTPARWEQVQAVFAATLERSPETRAAFLQGVSQSDAELAREVETLLKAHGEAASKFLESPAELDPTEIQVTPPGFRKTLPPGTRLNSYEILSAIGAGGMGQVYRARDAKLQRDVAIKVLPEELAGDPASLARFEREALAVAALSHPNILAIFDFGKQGSIAYAVMELLEGQTLRAALKAGSLPLDRVIGYAIQIAEGLSTAHERQIIHRDLKPENLFITRDDRLKILDFGLAKRVEKVAAGEETTAPTIEGHTTPGMVMGTLGYMSPEQLLGLEVDHRTDLFALGVVLYEMMAGKAPFRGNSAVAIADAILHKPPPELTDKAVPPPLKALIRRLLEKDAGKRYATASEALAELELLEASLLRRRLSRSTRIAIASGMVALAIFSGWMWRKTSRERWALQTAVPEIERRIKAGNNIAAAALAARAREILPKDEKLDGLWLKTTGEASFATVPSGAEVSSRPWGSPPTALTLLGSTPVKTRIPDAPFVFRISKPGFGSMILFDSPPSEWSLVLPAAADVPAEMVPVAAGFARLGWPFAVPGDPGLSIEAFLIDRHEATNAEYKRFVDAGGYENEKYWKQPFVRGGSAVSWKEAMESFRDATSRPGPSTWEAGTFPKGRENHPVAGVSWYEAAAYAEFVGKALPTIYHWSRAAQTAFAPQILPGSNFRATGTQPVEQPGALSGFGTFDMAGNVKEWCWNESGEGKRFTLGGGFGDPSYMFSQTVFQSPWDRPGNYGLRCAKLTSAPSATAAARKEMVIRDFSKERPASEELFRALRGFYSYDRGDLRAVVEPARPGERWRRETVTINAAYGGERLVVHVFLPRSGQPPFQTIVFCPGAGGLMYDAFEPAYIDDDVDFLLESGRILVWPIYKGMFGRRDDLKPGGPGGNPPASWRDHMVSTSKDLGRTLDYLETRPDVDAGKIGYFGFSWGASVAPVLLAVEPRVKAAVLESAGFWMERALPEADQFNFAGHVRIPTLVLSDRFDHLFSVDAAQLPFFRALGTPEADKRRVIFDSGHGGMPRKDIVRESLDWFDKYLGVVKR